MNYEELRARVLRELPNPQYAVAWYVEGQYSDASYTIVPLPDGRFTLYRPSGRGDYYEVVDAERRTRVFASEAAVCDFVWAELTAPAPTPIVAIVRTPEEKAARLADQRRRFYEARGEADPDLTGE